MNPVHPNQTNIEAHHRSLLIIWIVLVLSVAGFMLLTLLVPSNVESSDLLITIVLLMLGLSNLALSFVVKRQLLAKSVANQDLQFVLRAYIAAMALSESTALFGVVIHFITGSSYYLIAFGLGILGMLLHFPKKRDLLNAAFKEF